MKTRLTITAGLLLAGSSLALGAILGPTIFSERDGRNWRIHVPVVLATGARWIGCSCRTASGKIKDYPAKPLKGAKPAYTWELDGDCKDVTIALWAKKKKDRKHKLGYIMKGEKDRIPWTDLESARQD